MEDKVIFSKQCNLVFLLKYLFENLRLAETQHATSKVEKILEGSLNLIPSPSPSLKIQIVGGKVCLRCKGKTFLGVVNKLLKIKILLTMPSNILLPAHNLNFH